MPKSKYTSIMPKAYDPKAVEKRMYDLWMNGGYFTPDIDPDRKPYVMIMPPPNVTGELHMGHALTTALEDLMVRWHRMNGDPTLYLPGTDHAGIATQVVVERQLAAQDKNRHDLGREEFVKAIWQWVQQYGDRIYEQIKRLGASCDWTRQTFTLDEGPSKAVRTTFVNLYKEGLIYRGNRIVNWCPRCATALSDLEVKHQDQDGALYHIRYKLDQTDDHLVIATTRPETMLGDTAVAVNPEDSRYSNLIGKTAVLPVQERVIPIIGDNTVDTTFGTGALKVTPGHDHNDFDIAQRHDLPTVNVMDLTGNMNENAGHYQGIDRFTCRTEIVKELDAAGLIEKIEPMSHSVGHCDRCNEIVEPIVSKQWYMKMSPLADPAIQAVRNGTIRIIPERFTKIYYNWMENIRDWCISRQLWWGHQIPVWYCKDCDGVTVDYTDPKHCSSCSSSRLVRDPDVLDTWFSSALWPHSTLGWPNETEYLDYLYPTSDMETGHDILFFWVARMIMMGIKNTSVVPFDTVYLHGLVRDPEGVKMSKSRGNVMDPLDLIDVYGADALRFALTSGNSPGNDMRLNEQKMESSRNFANKLWNAARFVINNLDQTDNVDSWEWPPNPKHIEDRWIISRLNRISGQVKSFMEDYQFGEAQRTMHDFLWGEYCDWYLETAKVRINHQDATPIPISSYILERLLRLLHPFMPFITEEIWQNLSSRLPENHEYDKPLIIATYPTCNLELIDENAEADMAAIIEMIRAVRNLRAEFRIKPTENIEAIVNAPKIRSVIQLEINAIKALAHINKLTLSDDESIVEPAEKAKYVSLVLGIGTVKVPLSGLVDIELEIQRLSQELKDIEANRQRLISRLGDEKFLSRAPEDVVERERERLDGMESRRGRVIDTLSHLK